MRFNLPPFILQHPFDGSQRPLYTHNRGSFCKLRNALYYTTLLLINTILVAANDPCVQVIVGRSVSCRFDLPPFINQYHFAGFQ